MKDVGLWRAQFALGIWLASMSSAVVGADNARTGAYIPCADFTVGSTWTTRTTATHFTETATAIVIENSGGKVRVAEKKTQTMRAHPKSPEPPPVFISGERQYLVVGSDVSLISEKNSVYQMSMDPPVPTCGEIPAVYTFNVKSSTAGHPGPPAKTTATARSLGTQTITVPAGTYDATVVEIQSKNIFDNMPAATAPAPIATMYAVKGIGVIKTVTRVVSMASVVTGAPDPAAEAIIGEGLEKIQKGGDASDVFAKMQAMKPPDMKMQEVESTIVMELLSYRPGP